MKYRKNKENNLPSPLLKKHIRKFTQHSYYKQDSTLTTLTKSNYEEDRESLHIENLNIPQHKSTIIPSLRAILQNSTKEVVAEPVKCSYISLEEEKGSKKEFKLFREKDVPLFTQGLTKILLKDSGYDNDLQTDNEQINNGINLSEHAIKKALRGKRRKDVRNVRKYATDKVLINDKHRIY